MDMDGGKLLKSVLLGSLFLGSCLFGTRVWATGNKTTNAFWLHDLALSSPEMKVFKRYIKDEVEPDDKLYWAVWFGNKALTKRLLEEGADVDAIMHCKYNSFGTTSLERAAGSFGSEMVKLLLKFGADPNRKRLNRYGYDVSPLKEAVHHIANLNTVKLLLKYGADPHQKYAHNLTLLHAVTSSPSLGMSRDWPKTAKLLLGLGIDPNSKDDKGRVPLINIVDLILSNTNLYYRYPLRQQHEQSNQYLLQKNRHACKALKLFVDWGADINAQDNDGNTALHEAVRLDLQHGPHLNLRLLRTLIRLGANVNPRNNAGDTPLDVLLNQLEALPDDAQELKEEYNQAVALLQEHDAICKANGKIESNAEANEN
ncbi:MAG: ankyrin repeat domain-containing protein [Puniceicoccales bacterium]|jgi:ankyrin repeat protein|nr:ankyrin repeat domain-containing protein [Puniceicoccales bacterium]